MARPRIRSARRCRERRRSGSPWSSGSAKHTGGCSVELQPEWNELLRLLKHHGVRFVMVGGLAVGVHGHERYTKDLDLLVDPSEANARRLGSAIPVIGMAELRVNKLATGRPQDLADVALLDAVAQPKAQPTKGQDRRPASRRTRAKPKPPASVARVTRAAGGRGATRAGGRSRSRRRRPGRRRCHRPGRAGARRPRRS